MRSVPQDQFNSGNLVDIPISKNVLRQVSYEPRRNSRPHDDLVASLNITTNRLRETFPDDKNKVIGYVQCQIYNPLTIALWVKNDIMLYEEMAPTFPFKVDSKRVFYFAMVFYDKRGKEFYPLLY